MNDVHPAEKPPSNVAAERPHKATPEASPDLDLRLFLVVLAVLIFILTLLAMNLIFQHENYARGVDQTMAGKVLIDHSAVLAYSRAWDFAVVKTSSIFLAFTLILLGALYVLRAGSIAYKISVAGGAPKGSFETGSPGLVMITLGIFLMVFVIQTKTDLNYGQVFPKKAPAAEESKTSQPLKESSTKP